MMSTRWFKPLVLGGLLSLSSAHADVIRIAVLSSLSGEGAVLGNDLRRGAELALQARLAEFRQMGHILQLVAIDDLSNPTRAKTVAQALLNDASILGVVGPQASGVTYALGAEISQFRSPLAVINLTSSDSLTENGWNFFSRIAAPDRMQAQVAALFIAQTYKPQKGVFLVSDDTTYGNSLTKSLRTQFARLGIPVLGYMGSSQPRVLGGVLGEIQRTGADVVYFGGTDTAAAAFYSQLRAKGLTLPFVGGDGLDSAAFSKGVGSAGRGVVFSSMFAPYDQLPAAAAFVKKFQATYRAAPNGRAAASYDATNVLLDAIASKAKGGKAPTRAEVISAVRAQNVPACQSQTNCKALTGPISFTSKGERRTGVVYMLQYDAKGEVRILSSHEVQTEETGGR